MRVRFWQENLGDPSVYANMYVKETGYEIVN